MVAEYAANFEKLVKLCPYYNSVTTEGLKCIEFESRLQPEIKKVVGYQGIHHFCVLVNKYRIYDEDIKA